MRGTIKISTIVLCLFSLSILSTQSLAQQADTQKVKIKISGFLNSGYENNLFYSPTSLRSSDGSIIGKDSLIRSGGFALGGVNFLITKKNKKKTFSISGGGYYKNYFSKNLRQFDNQNIDLKPVYQYNFKKSDYLRMEVVLAKNKITRALTLDEESIIPLSYYRVNPHISYQRLFFHKVSANIKAGYDFRKYKESTNELDFTYGEIFAGTGAKYRHKVKGTTFLYKLDYSYANRTYFNWFAEDEESSAGLGDLNEADFNETMEENLEENWEENGSSEIKRNNWIYHRVGFSASVKINPRFKTGFTFGTVRKVDAVKTDFGFNEFQLGLGLNYKIKSLSISFNSEMSQRKYTTRRTEVANGEGPLLTYNYLNGKLRVDYKLTKRLSVNTSLLSRIRTSNSIADTRMTRRSYSYFSVNAGLFYTLEYKKKKKDNK